MPMADYERAAALLKQNEDEADFVGERPPELIETAERAVGFRFPPTYRRFLSEYGAGSFGSTEIYGVIDSDFVNSSVPDAIWLNLTSPQEALFVFYNVGDGTELCLDTRRAGEDGEMPVVAIHGDPRVKEHIAADFGSALLLLVEEELALDDG